MINVAIENRWTGRMLKILAVVVAGMLTIVTLKRFYAEMQAQRVRVKATQEKRPQAVTRLREDPRTGVYYPEN